MMTGSATIARPYALAAFEYARDKHDLMSWKTFLEMGADVSSHPLVRGLLNNPEVTKQQLVDFYANVLGAFLNEHKKNFLLTLADNRRLNALPEISTLFNTYYDALQKTAEVQITTAVAMDEVTKQKMAAALTKRLNQQVQLHSKIDPAVIAGAVIRIGDRVIDGSVRGKLARLLEDIS